MMRKKKIYNGFLKFTEKGWQVTYEQGKFKKTILMATDECKNLSFETKCRILFTIETINNKQRAKLEQIK